MTVLSIRIFNLMHPCGPSGLSDFTVNRSCLAPLSQSVLTEMPREQKSSRAQVVNHRLIREKIFCQALIRIPNGFCWTNSL